MPKSSPIKGDIHLLLTDVVLPRISGRKPAEQLKGFYPESDNGVSVSSASWGFHWMIEGISQI